ncbi:uncharacterized protein PFL1_05744 [Pseudozyma flocculosa PF-1]|uniref:Zn(2)-C6 fungal-type domain-containing protein n=2 Tax=Pseudozyma flocculosa TaxID=84751 RepID=A0A5C3FBY9_9BASI|nr:uncharacterized protein PFL1_05744 [Pseudozyma flocculosa PF-1]EPQ26765.1 hypothetical protein PFL1_05744 [Pseudozyma flocculosa PF-1]SPO40909.1 uncharacterized protein PSFLO_06391 [Pseudozyma flocculosa]
MAPTASSSSSSSSSPPTAQKLPGATPTAPATDGSGAARKRKRVSRACDQCFTRKDKCDGLHPVCSICRRLSIPCTYQRPERKRGPVQGIRQKLEAQVDALETLLGFCVQHLSHDVSPALVDSYRRCRHRGNHGDDNDDDGDDDDDDDASWQAETTRYRAAWRRSKLRRAAIEVALVQGAAPSSGTEQGDPCDAQPARPQLERMRSSTAIAEAAAGRTMAPYKAGHGGAALNAAAPHADIDPIDHPASPTVSASSPPRSPSSSSRPTLAHHRIPSFLSSSHASSTPSYPATGATSSPASVPAPAPAPTPTSAPTAAIVAATPSPHRITIPTTIPSYVARGPPPLSSSTASTTSAPAISARHRPGSTYRNRGLVPPGTDPNDALGGFHLGFQDDEDSWYSGVLQGAGGQSIGAGAAGAAHDSAATLQRQQSAAAYNNDGEATS